MDTNRVLILARKNVGANEATESSARFCMWEAVKAADRDDDEAARMWAVKSLAHSVGVAHEDFRRASA